MSLKGSGAVFVSVSMDLHLKSASTQSFPSVVTVSVLPQPLEHGDGSINSTRWSPDVQRSRVQCEPRPYVNCCLQQSSQSAAAPTAKRCGVGQLAEAGSGRRAGSCAGRRCSTSALCKERGHRAPLTHLFVPSNHFQAFVQLQETTTTGASSQKSARWRPRARTSCLCTPRSSRSEQGSTPSALRPT